MGIDPGTQWKGPWRFFDESTLKTCDKRKPKDNPLDKVIDQGMTFEEFLYMAECNGASVVPFRASDSSLSQFNSAILASCTRHLDDLRLVCSYNRSTLQQTGTGHFSPIAGYHCERNLVLLLDVARFKYPSHWISVELLWKSMSTIDNSTGKTRGFYLLSRWANDSSLSCRETCCTSTTDSSLIVIDDHIRPLCAKEESMNEFIDLHLCPLITYETSFSKVITGILKSLPTSVIQLATKWSFDIMQKYRYQAIENGLCQESCQCSNPFESYSTFIPQSIENEDAFVLSKCSKPCQRVTRSHIHLHAVPTQCVLLSFIKLFEEQENRPLYELLTQMHIERELEIDINSRKFDLFGAVSSIVDDENCATLRSVKCGLCAIFLFSLSRSSFLSSFNILDWSQSSTKLKEEIIYARNIFGITDTP